MEVVEPRDERAERYAKRTFWLCAALSLMVGVFLVSDVTRSADEYGAAAWVGVGLAGVVILALAVLYGACALGRVRLDRTVIGKLDLFKVSTICLVVAVGADILIPDRQTGGLALLLPWGITYWMHNLNKPPA
ncbi:MAG TPA: hypothetical protein VFG33_18225 [Kribbella sp.]|uniref:hypothetical protein n=1 Tax=Kribbella sp. TaxID=1871183 RepID=UPI002D79DD5D|nr:hypothetical protein [Kribbella sp.]HET6295328.1 hypothetical protein [Kribbella sp.]